MQTNKGMKTFLYALSHANLSYMHSRLQNAPLKMFFFTMILFWGGSVQVSEVYAHPSFSVLDYGNCVS